MQIFLANFGLLFTLLETYLTLSKREAWGYVALVGFVRKHQFPRPLTLYLTYSERLSDKRNTILEFVVVTFFTKFADIISVWHFISSITNTPSLRS